MAILNVRNLREKVQQRLRLRAARAGRSMEAEARESLTAAVQDRRGSAGPRELQSFVDKLYGDRRPTNVVDALIEERRREGRDE